MYVDLEQVLAPITDRPIPQIPAAAPVITIFVRHAADCKYAGDEFCKRCACRKHFRWTQNGKQYRRKAGTRSWAEAERLKRTLEDSLAGRETPEVAKRISVEDAIRLFMDNKQGEDLAAATIRKLKRTLDRLQDFCDRQGIFYAKDITLSHLTTWRASWTNFESPLSKRNNQERVKSFFRYCSNAGLIPANPALQLSPIQVKADEANSIRPFEPKEYKAILAAITKTALLPENQARVRACMQLQRWSGLSLIDAVCLTREQLIQDKKTFRVRVERAKTGAHINNVIPTWLGRELLKVKNGNPKYFFMTGQATPKSAVSIYDKMYRKVFKAAKIDGTSHMFRHTFSVELLKAGVDIRKVSKALGHSSVTITERYYAKWNKAQQDILDSDLARAWN